MRKHLTDIGESYTEHAIHALWIAGQTALVIGALMIHAMFPDVSLAYASDKLAAIETYRKRRSTRRV